MFLVNVLMLITTTQTSSSTWCIWKKGAESTLLLACSVLSYPSPSVARLRDFFSYLVKLHLSLTSLQA